MCFYYVQVKIENNILISTSTKSYQDKACFIVIQLHKMQFIK